MTDILKAVEDSRAVGQTGWTRDDVRYAISFTIRDRDAEWRAAVERVRELHPGVLAPAEYSVPEARVWARGAESALKSLLAAMEAK